MKAEIICVGSGAIRVASDLLGPFFARWGRCSVSSGWLISVSRSLKDRTLGWIGLETPVCWVLFAFCMQTSALLLLLRTEFVLALRLIVVCVI